MSYGTPDQLEKLLTSIKGNVDTEPTATWTHPGVRVASRELADLLQQRMAQAVDDALTELGFATDEPVSLEDNRRGDVSDGKPT